MNDKCLQNLRENTLLNDTVVQNRCDSAGCGRQAAASSSKEQHAAAASSKQQPGSLQDFGTKDVDHLFYEEMCKC